MVLKSECAVPDLHLGGKAWIQLGPEGGLVAPVDGSAHTDVEPLGGSCCHWSRPVEMFYIVTGILLLLRQSLLNSVLFSSVISIALMEYFFWNANSNYFYPYHRVILRAVKGHILTLALFICTVLFAGTPWWAGLLLITIYLLTAFSPSIITSVILHGNKMHPKYAFAKKRFGLQYPWDSMGV